MLIYPPTVSCGLPVLRSDAWARRELDEHAAALCRLLHGHGQPRTCSACRRLTWGGAR